MTPFLALSVAYALAAAILAFVAVAMARRCVAPSGFVVAPPLPVAAGEASSAVSYVHPPGPGVAHAVTVTTLTDGRLAAYWFAGSREGAPDVAIRMSVLGGGVWGEPRTVTDRQRTGREQGRFIKTVGNPVVFRHPDGGFWLIYVSVSFGGWSGSALNLMRSPDGIVWGASERLVTGPFANVSTLVRGPAILRADGLVALPAYHEFIAAYPELILIDPVAHVVDKVRMGDRGQIQPWVVARDGRSGAALMRAFGRSERRLWVAATDDAGATWQTPCATLANPDSPAAAVLLADGRIAAVVNDDPARGDVLDLVVSEDGGATWEHRGPVFGKAGGSVRYRYPWMMQDGDGRLHVFVTEGTNAIRHAVLGAETVAGGATPP